jgi:hypothetical protein
MPEHGKESVAHSPVQICNDTLALPCCSAEILGLYRSLSDATLKEPRALSAMSQRGFGRLLVIHQINVEARNRS